MRIIIIGNGITGITAALTVRRLSNHQITIISGENPHFFARTALMYLYLGQLKYEHLKGYEDWFWPEKNINLVHDWANGIDLVQKTVQLKSGTLLPYDKLLLATGSETNMLTCPGIDLKGVHGFYSIQDLEQIEQSTVACEEAVIAGAGLIAVELAEMLRSRNIKTTILNRNAHYWGTNLPEPEARLVEKILEENGVAYLTQTEIQSLEADENGRVQAVKTNAGTTILCTFAGIATGVKPNLWLAKKSNIPTAKGIQVNQFLETQVPDVYAAGDCAQLTASGNLIEQLWYTGRLQGETVAYNLCGQKVAYNHGIPFNSAKFFEVEFQSYGLVNPELEPKTGSFYWQHPEKKISLRINYVNQESNAVCGFVSMGLRLRQSVCETWIKEEMPLQEILNRLEVAMFDPEFSRHYTGEILQHFKEIHPELEIMKPARRFFSWF